MAGVPCKPEEAGHSQSVAPKLVCINLQAYTTTQCAGADDILNIGGFSDAVFNVFRRSSPATPADSSVRSNRSNCNRNTRRRSSFSPPVFFMFHASSSAFPALRMS